MLNDLCVDLEENANEIICLTKYFIYTRVRAIRAVASGVLIGSSFVFKKKGLLRSQAGGVAGEGVAYLKSVCLFVSLFVRNANAMC